MTFDEAAKRRMIWLTRRGLLELDILLQHFVAQHFHILSDEELAVFARLLDLPDQEFLAQVGEKEPASEQAFVPLLEKIRRSRT